MCGFAAGNRTAADDKALIIEWHKARLSLASEQQIDIETLAPAVALRTDNAPVTTEPPAPIEQVETIPPAADDTITDDTAITERYDFNAMVQLSVYVGARKQCHIALSGFYLNALMTMAGIDKKGCKAWIQSAVDNWGAFDAKLNVTKQIESLIVRELESELLKARKNSQ